MKKTFTLLFVFSFLTSGFSLDYSPIITQYYEGASNDKWIEIANPTYLPIDLTGYYLCLYANAAADNPHSSAPNNNQALTGTLNPGQTLLFKHSSAVLPNYASGANSSVCNFNGDDLVIITSVYSTTNGVSWNNRTDVVGDGSNWGQDKSFYRNASIYTPNTTYTPTEWTEVTLTVVNNATSGTSEYLGSHLFNALPLTFENITAKATNKTALIEWTTTNEVNTAYMDVEHNNGASLAWKSVGKIAAAGYAAGKTEYSFTHETPLKGDNFYRIKQVDNDGTFCFSKVVYAHLGNTNTGLIITPNLVHNSLKISFEEPVENGRILIYNLDGKLVQSHLLAEGIDVLRVDVSELVSGQYVIQYQSDQGSETVRFVKE